MTTSQFDADGCDRTTYAPFELSKSRRAQSPDFIVQFEAWEWLHTAFAADLIDGEIDGYYMNGHSVEGLVKAAMFANGVNLESPGISYSSEGDTCCILVRNLDEAVRVAELAADLFKDRQRLRAMIAVARDQGFEE